MKKDRIEDMFKGWFVGNFEPTVLKTNDVEVALKEYGAGDYEDAHYHKIATEITFIVEGEVEMLGEKYSEGDIITILPNEVTDFKALTKVKTFVVKHPGANDYKYIA